MTFMHIIAQINHNNLIKSKLFSNPNLPEMGIHISHASAEGLH